MKTVNVMIGALKSTSIAYYDDYEKSYGYVIEKKYKDDTRYWNGKSFDIKAYAINYKTKAEASKVMKKLK